MSDPHGFEPTSGGPRRRRSRSSQRLRTAAGILLRLVLLLGVLGVGLALGDAYGDRPTRPATVSVAQGVDVVTVTRSVAMLTRTIVVTGGPQP